MSVMNVTAKTVQEMSGRQLLDTLAAASVALNVEDNASGIPMDEAGSALMLIEAEILRRMS